MEDRLQSKRVIKDNYLLQLCKYIHYNPVKAGLVKDIRDWEFSNYHEIVGLRKGTLFSNELLEMYPEEFENYSENLKSYEEYLSSTQFTELMLD